MMGMQRALSLPVHYYEHYIAGLDHAGEYARVGVNSYPKIFHDYHVTVIGLVLVFAHYVAM